MSVSTPSSALKPQSSASPLPDVIGLGGAIAGLAGGVAMAVVAALLSASMGQDIWHEPKRIAAIVYGPAALAASGFDLGPVLVGTLIHLLVSALLGAIFGIVTRRWLHLTSDFGTPVMAGLVYGLLIWHGGLLRGAAAAQPRAAGSLPAGIHHSTCGLWRCAGPGVYVAAPAAVSILISDYYRFNLVGSLPRSSSITIATGRCALA